MTTEFTKTSSKPQAEQPPTPLLNIAASIYPDAIAARTDQSNFRSVKFLQFLISTYSEKEKPSVVIVSRRSSDAMFQAVAKWRTKWLHRIGAAFLWVIFGSYVSISPHGVLGWAMERFWGLGKASWEGPALATLLAVLLLVAYFRGPKKAGLATLYVVFFPFVAASVLLVNTFSALGLLAFVVRSVGSITVTGANWILLLVAFVVIDRTTAPWLIVLCTAYLGLGAFYVLLSNFYWVTTPFQSVLHFAEWLERMAGPSIEKADRELSELVMEYSSAKPDAKARLREEILKRADTLQSQAKYSHSASERVRTVAGGKVVLFYVFAARFLAALMALVVIFAGIYRGIDRASPGAFSGPGIKNMWFSFYYSVVTFFTLGDGTVAPQSFLSQIAVIAQVLIAVVTLTVLALSFSTLSVDLAQVNGIAVDHVARRHFERCMELLRRRVGVTKETPVECFDDLKSNFERNIKRAIRNREKASLQVKPAPSPGDDDPNASSGPSVSNEPAEQS